MRFMYSLLIAIILNALLLSAHANSDQNIVLKTPDFSKYRDIKQKKTAFFNFMRGIVKTENKRVLERRNKLGSLRNKPSLTVTEKQWLLNTAKKYNVEFSDIKSRKTWQNLMSRVDIVPIELTMAQAANESSWGTSRFARKGRNFFGQWCFRKGCGLVPSRRNKGARHEVAVFKTVNASVAAYIHNLNTGRVYAGLRKIRQQLRAKNKQPEAIAMAGGLIKYSTRRMAYVKEIRAMIRYNRKLMLGK